MIFKTSWFIPEIVILLKKTGAWGNPVVISVYHQYHPQLKFNVAPWCCCPMTEIIDTFELEPSKRSFFVAHDCSVIATGLQRKFFEDFFYGKLKNLY